MFKEYSKGYLIVSSSVVVFVLSLVVCANDTHIQGNPPMATKIAQSSNSLGIQLYLILSSADRNNVVLSPFGLTSALTGTTRLGTQGKALEELSEVLQLNSKTIYNDFKQLRNKIIEERNDGVHVEMESILMTKDTLKIPAKYTDKLGLSYGIESKEKLHDKFKPFLKDRGATIDLVNKVLFKAHWEIPFSVYESSSFFVPEQEGVPDRKVQAEFMGLMSDEYQLNYLDDRDHRCQVIELNYGKDSQVVRDDTWDPRYNPADVSMVIVLPYKDLPLRTLEENLSIGTVDDWISKLRLTNIDVSIPKFNISGLLDFGISLEELGVRSFFSDHSQSSEDREGKLRSVWQELNIAAIETGTEKPRDPSEDISIVLISNPKKSFQAKRPFLFFIRDKLTKTILFLGRVMNPNQR